jgi:hypothetical protein
MHHAAAPLEMSRSVHCKEAGASTRSLKIANLPNDIREQLNLRLLEGQSGRELVAWLNALPAVQSVLNSQFHGAPISEVNLTLWHQGGYLQWLTERECFDSARALAEADGDFAKTGLSAERLLNVLTVRFGQLLMRWDLPSDKNVSETAEPVGVGAGGRSRKEASSFDQVAKKARILQGISRSLLAIHSIQLRRSNPARSLIKSESLAMAASTLAPKPSIPPHHPVAAENCASDASPKSAALSSARPVSSASVPGLAAAISTRLRALRGRATDRPDMLSEPVALSSILSHTPFKPDLDPSGILAAI